MADDQQNDFFGGGLRAYLERLAAEGTEVIGEPAQHEAMPAEPAQPPQPPNPPQPRTLDEREQALREREHRFAQHLQGFEAHAAALAQREEQVREREAARQRRTEERRAVRDVLREHAELSVARIIQVFDDALAATQPNGTPDHNVRLAAVRVLLGEAYADGGDPDSTAAAIDELAQLRQRRALDAPGP